MVTGPTLCLETDGTGIYVATCSQKAKLEQWWGAREVTYMPPLTLKMVNIVSADGRFSQKCMEVPNGSYVEGTELRMGTCTGGSANQTFFQKGLYQVPPLDMIDTGKDGMCLAINKGWVLGAKVVLRKCNENDVNQKFDDRVTLLNAS
jgi:hypothetical protein